MNKIVHAKFRALICTGVDRRAIATYPVITGKSSKVRKMYLRLQSLFSKWKIWNQSKARFREDTFS